MVEMMAYISRPIETVLDHWVSKRKLFRSNLKSNDQIFVLWHLVA